MNETLYELLMKATKFVFGMEFLEEVVDMEKTKPRRALAKIRNIVERILRWCLYLGCEFMLISMTGGLYLIWIA